MNLKSFTSISAVAATALTASFITAAPAQAATVTFSFTDPLPPEVSPSFVYTIGTLSVTATPNQGNVVQDPRGLGVYQGGLDILQIDRIGPDEILNLTFSESVRILSASFGAVGSNDDFTLQVNGSNQLTADIPGGNFLDIDSGTFDFVAALSESTRTGSVFGFTVPGNNDGYFLRDVTVETVPTPALLPGVIGFAVAALRKRKAQDSAQADA